MGDRAIQPVKAARRTVLKHAVALGVGAAVGPWVITSGARAAAGEVNVLMWEDSLPPGFLQAFTADTGMKINHTPVNSNREILTKMKATNGRGFDICSPTNMHSPQWANLDLLQPFDYTRLKNLRNVNPKMLQVGEQEWNFDAKGSHWLPHIWATEGVAWRTDLWNPPREGAIPSYGDCWQPDVQGKTMMRPHSGMLGAGLYLESVGALEPGAMRRSYNDEKTMRDTWQAVTEFCIKNKAQIKFFWIDPASQKNALLSNDVYLGQAWDSPIIDLMNAGEAVQYRAPLEGALAWVDGLSLSAKAPDLDAAYAFVDYCLLAKPAGMSIDGGGESGHGGHGYNSAIVGAEKYATPQYARTFGSIFPGDSLADLWLWPAEPQWYIDIRTEFRDEFFNA